MSKHIFKFKYEGDMIRCWVQEVNDGKGDHCRTAKNRHPGIGFKTKDGKFIACPIEYDNSTKKCYIYSEVELLDLKLVGTDEMKQKNRGTKEEFDAIPVTIQGVEV